MLSSGGLPKPQLRTLSRARAVPRGSGSLFGLGPLLSTALDTRRCVGIRFVLPEGPSHVARGTPSCRAGDDLGDPSGPHRAKSLFEKEGGGARPPFWMRATRATRAWKLRSERVPRTSNRGPARPSPGPVCQRTLIPPIWPTHRNGPSQAIDPPISGKPEKKQIGGSKARFGP